MNKKLTFTQLRKRIEELEFVESEHKKLIHSFQDSKDQLKLAFQSAKIATFETNMVTNIETWSEEALSLFGTTSEAFGGTYEAYLNFIPPETRDEIDQKVKKFMRNQSDSDVIQFDHEILRGDGKRAWIEVRARLFKDSIGNPIRFSGIGIDITSRKQLEEKLRHKTSKLTERVKELNCLHQISKLADDQALSTDSLMQSVVNLMPQAFQYPEITCATATINGVIYKTKKFKKTKWKISSPFYILNPKKGSLSIYYTERKPMLDEGPFLKEERYLIDTACKSVSKIFDRLNLIQKLSEIESRYKILTNDFAEGIVIIQDNQYKFVNKFFARLVGYSHEEDLINKNINPFIFRDFYHEYKKSILMDSEGNNTQDKIEYKLRSKDKGNIWVEEKRALIEWESAPALLCTIQNISDQKRREMYSQTEKQQLLQENIRLKSSLKERYKFQNIIGKSEVMQQVYDQILRAANSDTNVSIYGESGTGKELVANAIHKLSKRKGKQFVSVNCGAIPESLLESEFFGYKKGAFTGAEINKHGYLDLADKGSLFLDEIGELQLNMQAKLLRAIDGGGYHPIGNTESHYSDFRIITATNKDLKNEVLKGNRREDFYYRIHVIPINLPPLRDRKDDLPYLVEHFSKEYSGKTSYSILPERFMEKIYTYDWPGNVRELQNVLLRYFSTGQLGLLESMDLQTNTGGKGSPKLDLATETLQQKIESFEKKVILETLEAHDWHRIKASAKLGITRNTLFRKMTKYGLRLIHK